MLTLSGEEVRGLLDPVALRQALAEGYAAVSSWRADVPTRIGTRSPDGLLAAMPGRVEGFGMAAKLVSVFPGNDAIGLPTHIGLLVLFDETTGRPLAIMDAEVITEMRTSASAALACDLLAPPDVRVLTIVGAGVQASGHLIAFETIRPWTEIRIANRTIDRARRLAAGHPLAVVYESIDEAVEGTHVVACTTDAPEPLFDPAGFSGRHLSSVGIHLELPLELIRRSLVVVQTRTAVRTPPPNGPAAVQGLDPDAVVELGEVVSGAHPGRTSPEQVTAWVSVGHAMEDVVAARLAYDRAVASGVGGAVDL